MRTPDLIPSASRGDTRAFRQLVEAHQGLVYAVAFRFVRDTHDAEDITQEVFVRVWKNLSKYRPEEAKFTTWLYRVAANACLDFLKSREAKRRVKSVSLDSVVDIPAASSHEQELDHRELSEVILSAAAELAPKQRLVFILRDLEGLSPDEVCAALNMSPGNVKSNLCHARQKIAAKLSAFK